MTSILGAVLAGGQSRRFGADKAEALWRGRPLIAWAAEALGSVVDAVVICGRTRDSFWCVPDRPHSGLGPLGGLNAALHAAAARGFDAVLSAPCDVPRLPDNLSSVMMDVGLPSYLQDLPVIGLWPSSLARRLDAFLAAGGSRSMRGWAEHVGAQSVQLPFVFRNINTPLDLARMEQDAGC